MALTRDEVLKIAKLARIRLQEEEVERYREELNSILNWMDMLKEVDTENVRQLSSVVDTKLPWREDVITDGKRQEEVLANAPGAQYGCYVVPKMVE